MKTRTLKTSFIAAGIIAVFVFSGMALAQGPGAGKGQGRGQGNQAWGQGPRGGFGQGQGIERLAERLDLSDDQMKAITELHEQSRTKNQALRKDLLRLNNELDGELLKDSPDTKAVKGLVAKIGDLRTQMQQNRMETRLAVRQQLTPEQRDQMLLMGERSGRGGRHGRGGFDAPGARGPRGGRDGGFGRGQGGGQGRGPGAGFGGDCPRVDDDN